MIDFFTNLYIHFFLKPQRVPALVRSRRGAGILEYAILALVAIFLFGAIVFFLLGTGTGGSGGLFGDLFDDVRTGLGL